MAWLPMRDLFTGHDPSEFDDLLEADRTEAVAGHVSSEPAMGDTVVTNVEDCRRAW